jgi:predicted HicB family RNase H-like nuclease
MPTNKKAVMTYLNDYVYQLLVKEAKRQGRSLSNYIENALASSLHPEGGALFPNKIPRDQSKE